MAWWPCGLANCDNDVRRQQGRARFLTSPGRGAERDPRPSREKRPMTHTPDLVLDEEQKVRAGRPGPLHRFTDLSVRYVEKWMPDPYLFAVILTVVVVALIFALVPGASLGGDRKSTRLNSSH